MEHPTGKAFCGLSLSDRTGNLTLFIETDDSGTEFRFDLSDLVQEFMDGWCFFNDGYRCPDEDSILTAEVLARAFEAQAALIRHSIRLDRRMANLRQEWESYEAARD